MHHLTMNPLPNTPKVMIVDGEPLFTDLLKGFLQDAGYVDFHICDDTAQVLELLLKQQPDVLLLDCLIQDQAGFALLAEIRNTLALRYMPVLVLSAAGDSCTKLRALEMGATDFLAKPLNLSELTVRLRNALALKAYQDQLAYSDALTGLPNRKEFLERLSWTLKLAQRHNQACALLQIGLDRFKQINDTLGYEMGDEILKAVSRRLSASLRDTDTLSQLNNQPDNMRVSRLAGDEFMVLASNIRQPEDAAIIARRVLEAMKAPLILSGHEFFITASIGIVLFPQDANQGVTLLTHVAQAMAQAKLLGRNTYSFFSAKTNASDFDRLLLETALRKALENGQLQLYFQPKVVATSQTIIGAEALLRWQHAEMGWISPARFIRLAEDTGLILPIGEMVLHHACKAAAQWRQAGWELPVSVNVSSLQFSRGDLPDIIAAALQASGLPAGHLMIELTESLLMDNASANIAMLSAIKNLGVCLSMDDFGTGYSSLAYLKRFPLDELKIDKMFVDDLPYEPGNAAIVSAVIAMSHGLGLTVTAEGVETPSQADFLVQHGCDHLQGYLFSRPVSMSDFSALLTRQGLRHDLCLPRATQDVVEKKRPHHEPLPAATPLG